MCPLHPEPLSRSLPTPFLQVVTEQMPCVIHQTCTGNLVYTWQRAGAVLSLVTHLCLTLDPMGCSLPGSSVHGDSPGKNIGVGCHALLQGIFPTQGSNPGLWDSLSSVPPGKHMFLMLFSQIIPPSPSPTESKSPSFTSVSALLSCTQDRCSIFLDSICMC